MRVTKRNQGAAMLMALALLLIVAGIGSLMATRTLGEIKHSQDDSAIVQTLMLARGAANLGGSFLSVTVRDDLQAIVAQTPTSNRWSFGKGSGDEPKAKSVANDLESVARALQKSIDNDLCDQSVNPEGTPGEMSVRIHVTSLPRPVVKPYLKTSTFRPGVSSPVSRETAIMLRLTRYTLFPS